MTSKNLFATVLTHAAPSGNYRGESEENRSVLQKITRRDAQGQDQLFTVISPEAMRNALREIIAKQGLPSNRRRLENYVSSDGKPQLAVEFKEHPNAAKFADDFLFGYMVADPKKNGMPKERWSESKRDSVLRMNLAVSVDPYRFDATFHQSPHHSEASPWRNDSKSNLLHREVSWTSYQYPFALAGDDFNDATQRAWGKHLLTAISELSNVAGGHARAYYEMAPHSIVVRLTPKLVGGFDTYAFAGDGSWGELSRLKNDDLTPSEFWLGGSVVRQMPKEQQQALKAAGVHLYENAQTLLTDVATDFLGKA